MHQLTVNSFYTSKSSEKEQFKGSTCYKLCMTEGHQERKARVNDIYRHHTPSNQCLIWTKSGKIATL